MMMRLHVKLALVLAVTFPALCAGKTPPASRGMVRIAGGTFQPLHSVRNVEVRPFVIDSVPVSAQQYAAFTGKQWRGDPRAAATGVTWTQAFGYCVARGARLPTTNEWEFLAQADEKRRDAAITSAFKQRALELAINAKPASYLIGQGLRNVWGVRDIHGGLAEWTTDFYPSTHHYNRAGQPVHTVTCASGTVDAGDARDYAAFMRYSLRKTLKVNSSAANVGFRCAL